MAMRHGNARSFKLKPNYPLERAEQTALARWLDLSKLLWYAIPNGEKRDVITGANLKRQGVKAGVPDICILEPRSPYHGLYIELKRGSGGVVSKAQREWLDKLNQHGYLALVAHGWQEAKEKVELYLTGKCSP